MFKQQLMTRCKMRQWWHSKGMGKVKDKDKDKDKDKNKNKNKNKDDLHKKVMDLQPVIVLSYYKAKFSSKHFFKKLNQQMHFLHILKKSMIQ